MGSKTKKLMWPPDFVQAHNFSLVDPDIFKGSTVSLADFEANCFIVFHHASHSNSNAHGMESEGIGRFGLDYKC